MIMRIHDLLEIDVPAFVEGNAAAPAWVAESLQTAPFVVVRRASAVQGLIAIGIRGETRSQRWAGTCAPTLIRGVVTPVELMSRVRSVLASPTSAPRFDTVPALRSLSLLAGNQTWLSLAHTWGPGGSVGFELATGHPTASPQSDLDLVIYADNRLSPDEAKRLHNATQTLPSAVDVRVETPTCGFSLTEYANQSPAPILLRKTSGVMLGADPWAP